MNKERWQQIISVVDKALDVGSSERISFVESECKSDPALKEEVIHFLNTIKTSEVFWDDMLQSSQVLVNELTSSGTSLNDPFPLSHLKQAGPYKVIKMIASGGMSYVYLAERSDGQFQRQVAIKILRRELDSEHHKKLFFAEREILSSLEHPNIARLYDAGIEDGRPYLVMEYVEGEPISSYCTRKNCTFNSKMELFKQVCEAVTYAHRNLIVHRDLKPDNIFVTQDGKVKILDFGIAKVIDTELSKEMEEEKDDGPRLFSVQYAAPEQIAHGSITTSTDVYALGLLLHELLAGQPPFNLAGKKLKEAEHSILNDIPKLPGSAVNDSSLARKLKGDLDAIILKALQKEPGNRYASVDQFLEDVHHHLSGKPVSARPKTFNYRTRKFITRRPGVVLAVLAVIVVISGYLITIQFHFDRLEAERNRAQIETVKAESISEFLMTLFESSDPDIGQGDIPTAFDLLDRGVERAEQLEEQPIIQAQMLDLIAQMHTKLGQYDRAEPIFRQALNKLRILYSEPHSDIAGTLAKLGDVVMKLGDYDEAEQILREALEIAVLTDAPLIEANSYNDLGLVQFHRGEYIEAEASHRRALQLRREALGEQHQRFAVSLHNIALALEYQDKIDEAEELYSRSLTIKRNALGNEHSAVTKTMVQLGRIYSKNPESHDMAELLLSEALTINRKLLGISHPHVLENLNDLAALYAWQEKYAEAEELFREVLRIRLTTSNPNHKDIAISSNNLAFVLEKQYLYSEAYPLNIKAVEVVREALGTDHLYTAVFIHNLGTIQKRLELYEDAELNFREAITIMKSILPENHSLTANPLSRLGKILTETGRAAEAEPILREALELRINANSTPADIAQLQFYLGVNLTELGQNEEAESLLQSALHTRLDIFEESHPDVVEAEKYLFQLLDKMQTMRN